MLSAPQFPACFVFSQVNKVFYCASEFGCQAADDGWLVFARPLPLLCPGRLSISLFNLTRQIFPPKTAKTVWAWTFSTRTALGVLKNIGHLWDERHNRHNR